MEKALSGKVAIVTGGGRGMGRAIARQLAAEGATIVIGARTASYGEDAVREIADNGGRAALFAGLELASAESCRALVDFAIERYGQLDILVLCAADSTLGSILDLDDESFDRMVRSNFHSAFWFTKAAIPHLAKSAAGRAIYISSGSGNKVNTPISVPYGSSKAALNALVRGAAHAYSSLGITFNCINPGMTSTDRMKSMLDEETANKIARTFPVPRVGTPEDIARAVAFLASPDSSYVTGVELCVDGGSTLGAVSMLDDILPSSATRGR